MPKRFLRADLISASAPVPSEKGLGTSDVAIVLLLLVLGAFQVLTVQRAESLGADSSVYMVLAHNIRETGRYEFNYRPHTVYPPGFPFLLAGLSMLTGREGYDVFVRFMPVFSTLALVAWYFVLRRDGGRQAAGAACLLVATSVPLYEMATRTVLSDIPFFLGSGLAFLFLSGLEQQDAGWRPSGVLLLTGLGLATAATVLLRSAGIALPAALLAWVSSETISRRGAARFIPSRTAVIFAAVFAFLAFFGWIGWTKYSTPREHPAEHGESYSSQFMEKDPHRPELGTASASDLFLRAVSNVPVQVANIVVLLARISYVMPTWYSPPIVITVGLLLCGLVSCIFNGRGSLLAWYFLAYFTIYLLWPYDEGPRFMLPVAPLAVVLIWRGLIVAAHLLRTRPTAALVSIAALGGVLAVATSATERLPGLQSRVAVVFWPLATAVPIFLFLMAKRAGQTRAIAALDSAFASFTSWRIGTGIVGILFAVGVFQQASSARTNLAPDSSQYRHSGSADCAAWLRTAGDGGIMAQQSSIIHRLSGRRIEDFPVTSDPQAIVDAVAREKVRYLVINDQVEYEYFYPTEEERWRQIERAYPSMFRLVHKGPGYRVFEVK